MKKEDLLQDVPADQRAAMLAEMACKTSTDNIRRHYSMEEKDQIKDALAADGIFLMEKEAEFSAIKKEFNKAIKEGKEKVKMALTDLKRGYSDTLETTYMMDDQEEGMMHIFDARGNYISSRRLLEDEKQMRIAHVDKTGTND